MASSDAAGDRSKSPRPENIRGRRGAQPQIGAFRLAAATQRRRPGRGAERLILAKAIGSSRPTAAVQNCRKLSENQASDRPISASRKLPFAVTGARPPAEVRRPFRKLRPTRVRWSLRKRPAAVRSRRFLRRPLSRHRGQQALRGLSRRPGGVEFQLVLRLNIMCVTPLGVTIDSTS